MPLDPQAQVVLDTLASLGNKPIDQSSVADAREQMKAFPAPPGQPVAKVEDLTATGPHGPIPVRAYTPEGSGPFPCLVYFHGGGWVIGDIETHDGSCRELCNAAGCVVVSVDYRLAPEHKFPAAADDCFAALKWVAANVASLNVDASRLAVGGDSAGGNLSAVVALDARDAGGPPLRFQLLVYPVTDHNYATGSYSSNADGYLLTKAGMEWFWDHYLPDAASGADHRASPLRAKDLKGLPPALVITAEFDPLRDEGEAYAARLREAGVPTTLTRYDGMIHGFFGMTALLDKAKAAVNQSAEALKTAFA